MIISWYGQSCFKIQSGELTIAIDPYGKDIGLTPPRFRADIIAITHEHFDHNNVAAMPEGAFVIRGPGDYEARGIAITGISTYHDASQGKERGLNTVFIFELEGIRVAHLGDFGEEEMRPETLDQLGEIDILLAPVGGTYTLDGSGAAEAVNAIEPKVVIPMHFALPGLKVKLDSVETFLKEMGVKNGVPEEKLTIKKKDIMEEGSTRVVILSAS